MVNTAGGVSIYLCTFEYLGGVKHNKAYWTCNNIHPSQPGTQKQTPTPTTHHTLPQSPVSHETLPPSLTRMPETENASNMLLGWLPAVSVQRAGPNVPPLCLPQQRVSKTQLTRPRQDGLDGIRQKKSCTHTYGFGKCPENIPRVSFARTAKMLITTACFIITAYSDNTKEGTQFSTKHNLVRFKWAW